MYLLLFLPSFKVSIIITVMSYISVNLLLIKPHIKVINEWNSLSALKTKTLCKLLVCYMIEFKKKSSKDGFVL